MLRIKRIVLCLAMTHSAKQAMAHNKQQCTACSAVIAIKQVSFSPGKSMVTLYHSLLESRLRYCNTVWGNCSNHLKQLSSNFKIKHPVLWQEQYMVRWNQIFCWKKSAYWIFQRLIDFETPVMVHKSLNDSAPDYLTNLFLRTKFIHCHNTRSDNYGIFTTHAHLKFGQRSFSTIDVKSGTHFWRMFKSKQILIIFRKV